MLHPFNRIARSTRRQRRRLVIVLALATTPAMAEEVSPSGIRMMPPLPLEEIERSTTPSTNQFCEIADSKMSGVHLASGHDAAAAVKLKPIDNALGLQVVDQATNAGSNSTAMIIQAVPTPGVRINPLAFPGKETSSKETSSDRTSSNETSGVQNDTAARSKVATGESSNVFAEQARKPIVQRNDFATPPLQNQRTTDRQSNPIGVVTAFAAPSIRLNPKVAEAAAIESAEAATPSTMQASAPPAAAKQADSASEQVPIFYSFSDLSDTSVEQSTPSPAEPKDIAPEMSTAAKAKPADAKAAVAASDSTPATNVSKLQRSTRQPIAVPPLEIEAVEPPSFDDDKSIAASRPAATTSAKTQPASVLNAAEPIEFADDPKAEVPKRENAAGSADEPAVVPERNPVGVELVVPFELSEAEIQRKAEAAANAVAGTPDPVEQLSPFEGQPQAQPLPQKNVAQQQAMQQKAEVLQRYRPAVEVKQVPIVVGRQGASANDGPAVQTVLALSIDSARTIEVPEGQNLVPLRMAKAEVRTLKVGGEITDVQLGDANICQVLKAAPNEIKLIGTDHGVTRLLVQAKVRENAEPQQRIFEIRIGAAVGDTVDQTQQHARLLNHSISEAFPNCRVIVIAHPDKLTVNGVCDGESSAKQIMRMVRKTCLVPVEDLLTIR